MNNKSCIFAGPTESELPFCITSNEYEEVENRLKDEILKLINLGVENFYVSCETGIDTTCAQLVIYLRDEMNYDIGVYPVITANEIPKDYSQRQLDDFEWIRKKSNRTFVYHSKVTKRNIRTRNRFVVKRCGYLIAIWDGKKKGNVWSIIKMAKKRKAKIEIFINL